ncbi:TetR/AcrR family transcriptional regulator [Iodidimonas sp. SYSU 1G8]|uniref:TetR/AcrR family transcriptional regulator n=1 Tax=Iodidimonas sp. SYSU 1G8 TaxID=3133967 RepID=UPI0031FEBFE5
MALTRRVQRRGLGLNLDEAQSASMGWQAQKSAATQRRVLESAIACFVEAGYSRTTTTLIADRAGLSRGAMLHHFPSKAEVVKAAVDYLHAKRLRAFRKAVAAIPPGGDRLRAALRAYWSHVTHPLFFAFVELKVTGRTDPELAEILEPAQAAFDEEWNDTARELFPEWHDDPEGLEMALDLLQYMLDGMALNLKDDKPDSHVERMLDYLENRLRELRPRAASTKAAE